jgi:hypothetical protein
MAPRRTDASAPWHDASISSREETSPILNEVQQIVGSVMPISSLSPVQINYSHSSSVHCFESSIRPGVDFSAVATGKNFSNIRRGDESTKNVEHKRPKRNSDTKARLHVSRKGDRLAKSSSRVVCSSSETEDNCKLCCKSASSQVREVKQRCNCSSEASSDEDSEHDVTKISRDLPRNTKHQSIREIPRRSHAMWATKVTGLVILVIEINVGNRTRLGFRLIMRSRVASMYTSVTMVIDMDRLNAITNLNCGSQLGSHLAVRSRVAVLCTWATIEMGPDVG